MSKRQLHLNAFHSSSGFHDAAWRLEGRDPQRGMTLDHHLEVAQAAEAAFFDSIFLAHSYVASGVETTDALLRWDPIAVLAAMAARTEYLGLIGTMSTTYVAPYYLAQAFATLDQISGGRAAWNIVTSASDIEARLFGIELPEASTRYARAAEFVQVCEQLWTSWGEDALRADQASGVFVDVDRVAPVDHHGTWFDVSGPFHLPPSPQRGPVLVQAGESEAGRAFAARYAEVIYTVQPDIDGARAFYADVKGRAVANGRSPDSIVILPGIATIVGDSEEEARERERELMDAVDPETGLRLLELWCGFDLRSYPLDGPVPPLNDPARWKSTSRADVLRGYLQREDITVRQLAALMAASRGHQIFVGTPVQLADLMQDWFESEAADGFNVAPLVLPEGLHEFGRKVTPILQERGLLRKRYEGRTLRERLGLVPR